MCRRAALGDREARRFQDAVARNSRLRRAAGACVPLVAVRVPLVAVAAGGFAVSAEARLDRADDALLDHLGGSPYSAPWNG